MTGILAIDTATDACSVAVYLDGVYREQYELIPRQHSQRLFSMLRALLPVGRLREQGIDAIAYSEGPGSFTGLRIGASAVQGLAYTSGLPAIGISTLALQAQTALRTQVASADESLLSVIDARINELYFAPCRFEDGLAVLQQPPRVCAPQCLQPLAGYDSLHAIGSGCALVEAMPRAMRVQLGAISPEVLPAARDLVPLALDRLQRGDTQTAQQVQPVYVRDEISWKKLSEQGRPQ
ncbi:tRNA (adenosine(37)-N6)-threonylcarbamoyltransferase complex dimerization subunit type 1 TsaB [Pseudomonadota bacterium]